MIGLFALLTPGERYRVDKLALSHWWDGAASTDAYEGDDFRPWFDPDGCYRGPVFGVEPMFLARSVKDITR
jgi:hypothetical protein